MLVVADHITPRLRYVLDYVFPVRLGIAYQLVRGEAKDYDNGEPVVCYTENRPAGKMALWIPASGFLGETGIRPEDPVSSGEDKALVLFPVQAESGIPFDLFSAVFWMISRYEEYAGKAADVHGRFPAASSLAVRKGWHDIPVVDVWINRLAAVFRSRFPGIKMNLPRPFFRLTMDVDQAFAVKGKGLLRIGAAMVQSVTGKSALPPGQYLRVAAGRESDPFDTFDKSVPHNRNFQMIWFFHAGRWGKYDKNIPAGKKAMQEVIGKCTKNGLVGLHPSYRVMDHPAALIKEKEHLETVVGEPVVHSRYHYIRFRLPGSYRILTATGITEDYSMGWPEISGFRAGTAWPFPWYDLENEQATSLMIHPFCMMDGVLKDRMGMTPEAAMEWLEAYIRRLNDFNVPFVPLWHNHALSETLGWEGWSAVYEMMVRTALKYYEK